MDSWLIAYFLLGTVAGFLAGLLGIGGSVIIVAVLTMIFDAQAIAHEYVLRLALGTGMATVIFTSLASLRAHNQRGAVRWDVVRDMTPGVIIGTFVGTKVAGVLPTRGLALFFAFFLICVAIQMALDLKPSGKRDLPGRVGVAGVGVGIGAVSGLVAVGGGSLTVPWLSWCNVRLQHAIGTSAAMGLPIAFFGTLGYIWQGLGRPGLPAASLGYVMLPVLATIVLGSVLTAPFGARMAHALPVKTLKRAFAALLLILATKMIWSVGY
ncbi:MAG: sulfite exporter TauE/SafE family protein [Rhodocyclaceae bacterium]